MALFFFHLRDGDHFAEDLEGGEFLDLAAARNEAIAAAREILAERLKAGRQLNGQQIEICDNEGTRLDTVQFKSVYSA